MMVDSSTGQPAECGNEVVEGAEECDDGNAEPGDGCEDQHRSQHAHR